MAGASKLALLLATPFSLLHRPSLFRLHRYSFTISLSTAPHRLSLRPRPQLLLPVSASSQEFHTEPSYSSTVGDADYRGQHFTPLAAASASSRRWPEWYRLLDSLSASGYLDRPINNPDDAFVDYGSLPEEFVLAANVCLAFARDRPDILGLLSRRDMEALVENGTPFLFQSAPETERRMRSFLGSNGQSYAVESDKAQTVDLMKYIVSYASNPTATFAGNNNRNPELTEASVRSLLLELADVSCRAPDSDVNAPGQYQNVGRYGQTSRYLGTKIEMKRGDWICPKCSFMNFARNLKCLECEEPRPKRQLTGAEWECPQCDFHNYGRNLACLRCDCKRPGEAMFSRANSTQAMGYNSGDYASKAAVDSRLAANDEKARRWFSKVSQQNPSSESNDLTADEDFPEIMPLRKGVNRFVVSTRKTPLDRRIANSQNQNNLGNYGTLEDKRATDSSSARSRLDSKNENSQGSNSKYAPFVPLPADKFAKRTQQSTSEDDKEAVMKSPDSISSIAQDQAGIINSSKESVRPEELSEKPSIKAGMRIDEKEQEAKSERWFKRIAELHDVSDLPSAVSDEDFPEIMPMRKGENRFVISKKKDRSLTSPAYKRQESLEQGSNTNFVRFVPFPPDYFAKKDKQQPGSGDSKVEPAGETFSSRMSYELTDDAIPGMNDMNEAPRRETPQTSTRAEFSGGYRAPSGNPNSDPISSQSISSNSWNTSAQNMGSQTLNSGVIPDQPPNPNSSSIGSQSISSKSWDTFGQNIASQTSNSSGISHQPTESQNVRSGWTGKSLEGSAVKEPDPLDMSEEAKAERWFRRVAQIKDISELSQIPDEDFPSIMPMRKGVNRFVVSKRKTPLERRLTSTQYRKNLPIVNSDPVKKENESS